MEEQLILVDFNDRQTGIVSKQEAHKKGLLHRAFSIFLFKDNKLLLQKRASTKYHCPSLWTNTCCSHPRNDETLKEATQRRLLEEVGISCDLKEADSFIYYASFDNGLSEYEIDHVFIGEYSGDYKMNKDEVDELKYMDIDLLKEDLMSHPSDYTPWFFNALKIALKARNK